MRQTDVGTVRCANQVRTAAARKTNSFRRLNDNNSSAVTLIIIFADDEVNSRLQLTRPSECPTVRESASLASG